MKFILELNCTKYLSVLYESTMFLVYLSPCPIGSYSSPLHIWSALSTHTSTLVYTHKHYTNNTRPYSYVIVIRNVALSTSFYLFNAMFVCKYVCVYIYISNCIFSRLYNMINLTLLSPEWTLLTKWNTTSYIRYSSVNILYINLEEMLCFHKLIIPHIIARFSLFIVSSSTSSYYNNVIIVIYSWLIGHYHYTGNISSWFPESPNRSWSNVLILFCFLGTTWSWRWRFECYIHDVCNIQIFNSILSIVKELTTSVWLFLVYSFYFPISN